MLLQERIAVITGAASGIGQATALVFARHGASLFCIDDRPCDETLALLREEKADVVAHRADVTDPAQVRSAMAECEQKFGRVHVLFNNAGRSLKHSFENTSEDDWDSMIRSNLNSVFLCAKYFLPLIKAAGSGSIINHASVDAILGNPSLAAYSAAKGAQIPLTHVMAQDLGKYRIRVNAISTGGITTGMTSGQTNYQTRIAVTPLGRMGTADEVAHVVLFLASDWSSYVSGANIIIDGGRTTITQGTYHG